MPRRAPRPAAVDLAVLPDGALLDLPTRAQLRAAALLPASVLPDAPPSGPQGGRPTKYTRRYILRLLEALCTGNYLTHACLLADVSDEQVNLWRKADADGDPRFAGFVGALRQAEAFVADEKLKAWHAHDLKDFRSPRDFLARRFPAQWGPQDHRTISYEGQAPQVHIAVVQPSDLLPMLGVLQQAGALPSGEAIAQSMDMIEGEVIAPAPAPAPAPGTGHADSHTDTLAPPDEDL